MTVKQITLAEANAYVTEHHRHHDATWGHKFSLGAFVGEKLVGPNCGAKMDGDGE